MFGGNLKTTKRFCCRHRKTASHKFSIQGNYMITISLIKVFVFYLVRYADFYAKTRKKFFENSITPI